MLSPIRTIAGTLFACFIFAFTASSASADPRFGVYTPGSPYGGTVSSVDALEGQTKRRISIVHWFENWGEGGSFGRVGKKAFKAVYRSGRTPLLTFEPWRPGDAWQPEFNTWSIAAGTHDGYLRNWARGIAKLRKPVYIRLMHEMNGNWYPWGGTINGNTPAGYKKAWRHVVNLFRSEGARNARWVWSPLNENVPATKGNRMQNYYPGKKYVNVLAVDGYNWGEGYPQFGGWRSFRKTFKTSYRTLTRIGKQPIWIAETGSSDVGGDKAAWIRDMWKQSRKMKRLKAIVWFDGENQRDWRAGPVASAFQP